MLGMGEPGLYRTLSDLSRPRSPAWAAAAATVTLRALDTSRSRILLFAPILTGVGGSFLYKGLP